MKNWPIKNSKLFEVLFFYHVCVFMSPNLLYKRYFFKDVIINDEIGNFHEINVYNSNLF